MQVNDIVEYLAPFAITVFLSLCGQLARYYLRLDKAKRDPIRFALENVIDRFKIEEDSLYMLNVLGKLIRTILEYVKLLYTNGESRVIEELKDLQEYIQKRIDEFPSKIPLSDEQQWVIEEVMRTILGGRDGRQGR